ncbi:MAG TPA: ATP-binding protein [Myxococcales bacterium]|nr:ATP-binding protein [Myxococcales bacterium]
MAEPLPLVQGDLQALAGGGEMGRLMREKDWSRTPLGPLDRWPQSLLTTVSTCINSRFPILIWWGPELAMLYNDAYRELVGSKHPGALGARGRDVWPEIWRIIGPMLEGVLRRGEATWSESILLPLERRGFAEECYFTFSYSPIRDESGGIGGVFTAVTETTQQVIGQRRLKTLRDLATPTSGIADQRSVCEAALRVLRENPSDFPFAELHLLEGGDGSHIQAPGGALKLPVARQGESGLAAVLVAGLSPRLAFDDAYRGFLELTAGQIGTALATARAFEEARRRAEALAEIDRAKTAFFSNVSHEFRTPLTLMLGPLDDLIRGSGLGEAEREQLALVHRNALRLLKLVNALLDFSRIEAGRVKASYEPVDLARLTADLASVFRSAVEKAGLRLRVDCPPVSAPAWVDRDMWEKIVLNLVSNAFKFTERGEIAVSLREADGRFELRVADTGVGIAAAELPHLFERFRRVEGVRARTQEGTGIGLALVQELSRLHGGTVAVESAPGQGSEFTVSIPCGSAHLPAERLGRPSASPGPQGISAFTEEAMVWAREAPLADRAAAAGPRARVLVADDNADMRDYLRRLIAPRWEVEVVPDGAAALASALARPPDLVLSDVMMPALDGFGLLRELRAHPQTAAVPVILLSARAGEEALVEGRAAGADDYMVKPFSARELEARIESQLALARLRRVDRHQRAQLARLFEVAPVFIAVMQGPDHVFTMANDAYRELVGRRELIGKGVREAFPDIAGQGFYELIDRVFATGEPWVGREVKVLLRQPVEDEHFVTYTYQPFRDLDGRVEAVAVFGFDVTGMVLARRRSEALAEQAQLADRRKDEFLAMLGHELRNPLAPIATAIKLMELRGDPASKREREVIERQVAHLSRLVDDLLDVQRIAHGKIQLSRRVLDIAEVAAKAVEQATPLFEIRAHDLCLSVPRGQLFVEADPVRLSQVVGNLLTNAAKYTPPHGHVELSAVREGGEVVLRVRDDGVGIPADFLPRVFDLFAQSQRSRDRADGGLGLGLAVVKSLVALHGGTVSARSDGQGKGSEFEVRLPLAQVSPAAEVREPRLPSAAPDGPRVLVVDDNADAAEVLAATLEALGHRVEIAYDGPQALEVQSRFHAQIGIFDLGLPVMDGYELVARMRELGLAPGRIIALTGYGQDEDRERSRRAGFDVHLVKPVELDELSGAIASFRIG